MAHTLDAETNEARPNFETLMNDDSFRYDCAAYVDDLARGRHDPQWLRDAWCAHESRKRGEFEWFLGEKFEEDWGIEIPDDMKVKMKMAEQRSDDGRDGMEAKRGHDLSRMGDAQSEHGESTSATKEDTQCPGKTVNNMSSHSMAED